MDSVTTRRCLVYPALNLFIHSITPPLIAAPTITAAHPPFLPLKGPWVAIRILVVLVCLLSRILPKCRNFCSPHGTLGRPMHGLQPQTTIPSASNFRCLSVSTITHPPRIQETPSPALHGLRHQSTIPDIPNLGGYGLSTYTLQPQTPELRASYGTPSLSLRELQPHHTFPDASYLSGCGLSTVTHLPGISGRSSPFGTIRPLKRCLFSFFLQNKVRKCK